jgi:hypothetical protein
MEALVAVGKGKSGNNGPIKALLKINKKPNQGYHNI